MPVSETVLETERLLLRRLTLEDVDDLAALYADPEIMRFFEGPRTRTQAEVEIAWCLEAYGRNVTAEAEVAYMIARIEQGISSLLRA
jgi:RimJ/RimL family protein N-acetyltransferase